METEGARILLADDEWTVLETYAEILRSAGHQVDTTTNGEEVLAKVREREYDLLLTDLVIPPTDGITVLKEAKKVRPSMLGVVFSGHCDVTNVLAAFRSGALDVLEKPLPTESLLSLAQRAVSIREMGDRRRKLSEELESERTRVLQLQQQIGKEDPFSGIVGRSSMMQGFIETLREVARTDSTVLLTGESGTGKSLIARAIHEASIRRKHPFVEANCVVYSEGVLHSELFGHERGAFTGAARTKKGRFELAHGGTLFLDEIGEIPPSTQLLLLRVLQERTFERVGGEETLDADVRLIAATNRDLHEAIEQGTFRSDLFYRLNVIPVHLPSLREHPEDIPVLAQHFVREYTEQLGRGPEGFDDETLDLLVHYSWPGNVRELQNMIERLVVLNSGSKIESSTVPESVRQAATEAGRKTAPGTLKQLERERIEIALREAGGNKKLAARKLGIHRSTLYAKMRRYGLDPVAVPQV
ncbi:MAG: sigma-54 dependent transcriptional regulator [Acidobacteriota bacterium]|nr:sigma-54 dependent transcriptional regulator [Acidobacteriota bacterium]MDH3784970.1 sigma-54 dependent transcriptional regulator [Acidobacteriota bacterium]